MPKFRLKKVDFQMIKVFPRHLTLSKIKGKYRIIDLHDRISYY